MKALVIYDSVFGNTERIARAMGEALAAQALRAGEVKAEQLSGVELLIVGSPTRGFRPTPATAAFLSSLPDGALKGIKAAAFDTRVAPGFFLTRLFVDRGGYANKAIAAALESKGATLVMPGEGFIVKASQGPLKEGELARAADWARKASRA